MSHRWRALPSQVVFPNQRSFGTWLERPSTAHPTSAVRVSASSLRKPWPPVVAARFVAPGDVEGLAGEISSLLANPDHAATLGAAARQAVRRFDGEVVAAAYIEAYLDAIAGQ